MNKILHVPLERGHGCFVRKVIVHCKLSTAMGRLNGFGCKVESNGYAFIYSTPLLRYEYFIPTLACLPNLIVTAR